MFAFCRSVALSLFRSVASSCGTLGEASGFAYRLRKKGDVEISHHGRQATVLRGTAASGFLIQISRCGEGDAQQFMAHLTGNYKRGNERFAGHHARNLS